MPSMVAADIDGNIFDCPELAMMGMAGPQLKQVQEWIPLPEGSELFTLPKRIPIGIERETGEAVLVDEYGGKTLQAVAAFVSPAYTSTMQPAYETQAQAPRLPLYCYTTVGWKDDQFQVPVIRIDQDKRQDSAEFNQEQVVAGAHKLLKKYSNNRLVNHLMKNCCLRYHCPAARNFALGRWEMPLPTSRACNSSCIGCISFQPDQQVCAAQDRISFTPSAAEIEEIVVPHFEQAERPIASFGQGCEGEPLTEFETLRDSIILIRKKTQKGTINLNTNGSLPKKIEALHKVGLNSIRVSINSLQPAKYNRYFRPNGYTFEDVKSTIRYARENGLHVSLNYFVFPGFTDSKEEIEALYELLSTIGVDMIQWRNLNIDPEWYIDVMEIKENEDIIGIKAMIEKVKQDFPEIKFGYFNPYLG